MSDNFSVRVYPTDVKVVNFTKRAVLSDIARLFDPLGWVSPVLIPAKILLQDLWIAGLDWDDELPDELRERYVRFRESLKDIESIRIPRFLLPLGAAGFTVTLQGYCDASERAYSALVYLRYASPDGQGGSNLVVAKTKVAPVKTLSVPRLELCAALLLARLIRRISLEMFPSPPPMQGWTDSKVALAWILSHASRWTTFVANRVSEIQETLPASCWKHVGTKENPADLATRGITPEQLRTSELWWYSPCIQPSPLVRSMKQIPRFR